MKSIGYIVENEESAQIRYRVENVAEALKKSDNWQFSFWQKNDEDLGHKIEKIDLLVIERQTAKDGRILKLISMAHSYGKKVVFDIDDLVFDYRDLKLVANTVGEKNLFYWAGYFWGIRRIAKRVDGFITTNDFLGKKLQRTFRKPYKVIFNSLNQKQIEESKKYLKKEQHDFRIGYFSGSPTHAKDFAMVEPELLKFLDEHEEAKLEVVGYMEFSDKAKKYKEMGRIKTHAPVSYLEMLKMMAGVDVNIAPLIINDFTNCKSELKFFEAAVVETTTIASPTYAFENAIKDGENGFLANPGEWYNKLEHLYKNPVENRKIAKSARKYAIENYAGEKFLNQIEEAYEFFTK